MSRQAGQVEISARTPEFEPLKGLQIPKSYTLLMTHKYRGSIVVLWISKSVEPNEQQKEMTSGFQ